MSYKKTNWVNGVTPISAANLNNIEDGISALSIGLGGNLTVEEDTPTAWKAFGSGYAYFNSSSTVINKPTVYGLLIQWSYGSMIYQMWRTVGLAGTASRIYVRYGNTSGWNESASVSGADAWVEILDEKTGARKKKLLWENASPTSGFEAQTVSVDLSEYDEAEIYFRGTSSNSFELSFKATIGKAIACQRITDIANSNQLYIASRNAAITSTGVSFEDGYYKGTTATSAGAVNNTVCVPIKIYGIKN